MLMIIPFYAILRSKFNLVLVSSRYYHDDSKETTNKLFFVSHEIPGKLWRCKIIEYENWAPLVVVLYFHKLQMQTTSFYFW